MEMECRQRVVLETTEKSRMEREERKTDSWGSLKQKEEQARRANEHKALKKKHGKKGEGQKKKKTEKNKISEAIVLDSEYKNIKSAMETAGHQIVWRTDSLLSTFEI